MCSGRGSGNKTMGQQQSPGACTVTFVQTPPSPPPFTWGDNQIQNRLIAEHLFFSLKHIHAWSAERRQFICAWLAEAPLRENDFAQSRVPYPGWLDEEIQDNPRDPDFLATD